MRPRTVQRHHSDLIPNGAECEIQSIGGTSGGRTRGVGPADLLGSASVNDDVSHGGKIILTIIRSQ